MFFRNIFATKTEKLRHIYEKREESLMKEGEIEKLFYKYGEKAYCTAFRLLNNESDAKDIVQDLFVGLYRIKRIDGIKNMGAYLTACCTRKAIDLLRKEKRDSLFKDEYKDQTRESLIIDDDISAIQEDENILAEKIREKMKLLPDQYRIIVTLHLMEDYGYREISEMTGLNENTVRSIYMRGKAKLINSIKEELL